MTEEQLYQLADEILYVGLALEGATALEMIDYYFVGTDNLDAETKRKLAYVINKVRCFDQSY